MSLAPDGNVAMMPAEVIAKAFHEAYGQLAPVFGHETRAASAVPWTDVPQANRDLMIATVARLLTEGAIRAPDDNRQGWIEGNVAPSRPPNYELE